MPPASARSEAKLRAGLLRLGWRFLAFFVVAAVVSALIVPAYCRVVAVTAGLAFRVVERPAVTSVRSESGTLWIYRQGDDGPEPFNYFDPYLYFAVPLVVSLILATPHVEPARRARRVAGALALLFALHVLYVVWSVELAYVAVGLKTVGPAARRVLDWAQVLLRLVWEAAPLAIFAGLTVRDWGKWTASGANRAANPRGEKLSEGATAG